MPDNPHFLGRENIADRTILVAIPLDDPDTETYPIVCPRCVLYMQTIQYLDVTNEGHARCNRFGCGLVLDNVQPPWTLPLPPSYRRVAGR